MGLELYSCAVSVSSHKLVSECACAYFPMQMYERPIGFLVTLLIFPPYEVRYTRSRYCYTNPLKRKLLQEYHDYIECVYHFALQPFYIVYSLYCNQTVTKRSNAYRRECIINKLWLFRCVPIHALFYTPLCDCHANLYT